MNKYNILIIAELAENIQSIKEVLENDYNIYSCNSLMEAISLQKTAHIDLVITDLKTNEIDVFDFLQKNRASNQDFSAMLVMTNNFNARALLDIINKNKLLRYMLKPWSPESLKATAKTLIDIYSLMIENKQLVDRLKENYSKTLIMLANALEARDAFAQGHSERVGYSSKCIARRMNFPEKDLEMLYSACLLHDIGKIGVPESILNKQGKLDDDDMIYIKAHTSMAERILSPVPDFAEMLTFIRSHHERIDGKGYPDGLRGEEIPIFSKIIAVADTFDSLTSERPFRHGIPYEEAITVLESVRGTQLDSDIVDIFVKMLTEKNISSIWELE